MLFKNLEHRLSGFRYEFKPLAPFEGTCKFITFSVSLERINFQEEI